MTLADAAVEILRSQGVLVKVTRRPGAANLPGATVYGRQIRIKEVLDKPYGLQVQVAMALWLLQQCDPPAGVVFVSPNSAIVQVAE